MRRGAVELLPNSFRTTDTGSVSGTRLEDLLALESGVCHREMRAASDSQQLSQPALHRCSFGFPALWSHVHHRHHLNIALSSCLCSYLGVQFSGGMLQSSVARQRT